MKTRLKIIIRGAVQGVGFRPFVYRLAQKYEISGYVLNSTSGVIIEAEKDKETLDDFLIALEREKPAPAIIHSLEFLFLDPVGFPQFEIRKSEAEDEISTLILPDIAVCEDCLREMFDPADRRYRYPFINCTNCGPRFSIIESLPYDRPLTSMKIFEMCDRCREEYENPSDRRFHAQPVACPLCGPQLELWNEAGKVLTSRDEALMEAVGYIKKGKIVAVKGLGGFHLVCDATNPEAIDRLRERKHREEKPFALMMASIKGIKKVCEVSSLEERLLKSPESPIVLLKRKASPTGIFSLQHRKIAPENPWLGIMLPYTPLHHLLMRELSVPIVATSGNISEEPMCIDENQALRTLGGIADVFLIHNRPIVRHVDDSIARIIMGREMILRRARGYAPLPVQLNSQPDESSHNLTPSLAVGGHLKNTIAIAKGNSVFISQHIGDLSTQESLNTFERVIQDFQRLYRIEPEHYVIDMHPDYLSGKYARSHFDDVRAVQHHEAHIAACRAENQVSGKALGVSWDGTGFGRDETIWGGEFFISDEKNHKRIAHFRNFPLPGSDEAIREPRRSALGILYEIFGSGIFDHNSYIREHFSDKEILFLRQMLAKGYNSPRTSSVGRLFDAVAALLNVRQKIAYEGQAAMMLEFLVDENEGESYQVSLEGKEPLIVNWEVMIRQILTDVESGLKKNRIAARFHTTLANVILAVARTVNLEKVVLSGGCFQNTILLEKTIRLLQKHQFHPYWHQRIPPNDGGISLGQTVLGRDTGAPENAPGGRYNFADLKMNQ